MFTKTLISLTLAALVLSGCGEPSQDKSFSEVTRVQGRTMGTYYTVTVPGGFAGGEEALQKLCEDSFKELVDDISTFDEKARLARFNAYQATKPFEISQKLAKLIEEVNHEARRINFAVDISVGPLVNLWGFGPDGKPGHIPTQEEIDEVKAYVGPDKYELRQGKFPRLIKADPRVRLDLSTVGEGVGADIVAFELDKLGVKNYMVAVAGAIRSQGVNPKGEPWRVGIENPVDPTRPPFAVVCPQAMAMSTSGSYRNFYVDEETGMRYSHIIDPATGRPVQHTTVSVTVIDRAALITDTLDTGLMVMGADEALKWGDANETAVYAIEINDKGEPEGRYNRYFEPYLKCDVKPR